MIGDHHVQLDEGQWVFDDFYCLDIADTNVIGQQVIEHSIPTVPDGYRWHIDRVSLLGIADTSNELTVIGTLLIVDPGGRNLPFDQLEMQFPNANIGVETITYPEPGGWLQPGEQLFYTLVLDATGSQSITSLTTRIQYRGYRQTGK